MNPSDTKMSRGTPESGNARHPSGGTDDSLTAPQSDADRARAALQNALREERHSVGILGEIDGGAVQFEPDPPKVPTDHPELQDEPKRHLDPPTDPPEPSSSDSEGPGPAEGHTDNKAGG